ncbi:putative RDD family membrane protein YckC [Alkalibacillus flavidus]|uniref:RDD family membrane protein YckC n=1 Tax=Alkalibacillus flavidus TaxID=546021 RepID=A0ABV2KWL5_9BACI
MTETYESNVYEADEHAQHEDVRYAGFWMRFWAYVVDLIVVFAINGVILMPYRIVTGGDNVEIGFWTVAAILTTIVLYAYFVFMTKWFNQTLGKRIFGLRVIRQDREPLSWSDLVFREVVGRFFYRVLGFTNLLYIVVAFNPEKQGIHDMIGDTYVIHE